MRRGLTPLATDPSAAVRLAREAYFARREPGDDPSEHSAAFETRLLSGRAPGLLWSGPGGPIGLVLWGEPSPLGAVVRVLHLDLPEASATEYGRFLGALESEGARIAFLSGGLAGLSSEDEEGLLRAHGFAKYGRSELEFPAGRSVPGHDPPTGIRLRSLRPDDLPRVARVHRAAYSGRFDEYLFLRDPDPERDAALLFEDLRNGRWGELLPQDSTVAEDSGRPVGATVVIGTDPGALIADVVTDPAYGGRGIGAAMLSATLSALRAEGQAPIRLAVTEGNRRARRLYERIGFVVHAGPTEEWYRTDLVPVGPEDGPLP